MLPPPGQITHRQKSADRTQILLLCDDGRWHTAAIVAWHLGGPRRDVLLDYHAAGGHFGGWFGYSSAAIQMVPEDWWLEPQKWMGEL